MILLSLYCIFREMVQEILFSIEINKKIYKKHLLQEQMRLEFLIHIVFHKSRNILTISNIALYVNRNIVWGDSVYHMSNSTK